MSITILGIESSCDDTSAAVIRDGILLSNVIASQNRHCDVTKIYKILRALVVTLLAAAIILPVAVYILLSVDAVQSAP